MIGIVGYGLALMTVIVTLGAVAFLAFGVLSFKPDPRGVAARSASRAGAAPRSDATPCPVCGRLA